MKRRAVRAAVLTLELLAILVAAVCAGSIFLYWRLGQGPVSLDMFRPSVEHAIERRLPPDYDAVIGSIDLHRSENGERGRYHLAVDGFAVLDPAGAEAAYAPRVDFDFAVEDVFSGALGPRIVRASGARFKIVRNRAYNLEVPGAPKPGAAARDAERGVAARLFTRGLVRSAFREASLDGAQVLFVDDASGRSWTAPDASVSVRREGGTVSARLAGDLDVDGTPASIRIDAKYTDESGVISASARGENFPAGDVVAMFYGERAAIVDAPVSGRAAAIVSSDGDIMSSSFEARIGPGVLRLGGAEKPLSGVDLKAYFEPAGNDFTIERLAFDADGTRGRAEGVVRVAFAGDIREPSLVLFDLDLVDLVLDAGDALPAPLSFDGFSIAGGYSVADRRLNLNQLRAEVVEVTAEGGLALIFPRRDAAGARPSLGVSGALTLDGALDPERLLRLWPRPLATGARDWVEARMDAARIDNIRARFDFAPGAVVPGEAMPDDALDVTFDISDATARFIEGVTPLSGAAGKGVLRGNSFRLVSDRGRVGSVSIGDAEIEFPGFMPKWGPTYYRFSARGTSQALLGVLDEAPLRFLAKANLSPDQFVGEAVAEVEIMRPNKRVALPEEYRYSGAATFKNMTVTGLAGDVALIEASGNVDLDTRGMTVAADALLSDEAPINLVWTQNFFREDGPSRIAVEGEIDSSTGDLFGVPTRQFLHGPIDFSAIALGELGAIQSLDIKADFTKSSLTVDALGWRKPAGQAASGDLSLSFEPDAIVIDSIGLEGDNVGLDGEMRFALGGGLESADLRRIYLTGAADLSLTARRDAAGVLSLTAVGEYLNAAPLIEQALGASSSGLGAAGGAGAQAGNDDPDSGFSLTARLEELALRNGVAYAAAAFDMRRSGRGLQALDFSALGRDGAPLRVAMALTGDDIGPAQAIEVRSDSIGDLLNGVFGVSSVSGGKGAMRLHLPDTDDQGVIGRFEGRDLHIVNAPMLARIFSAGSLDGLSNLVNGKGIDFSYAYGEFDFNEGVVMIDNARATGPSVGITAQGGLATGEGGEISLAGAVAPIYQLNSALGNAPIIGDILVGKKGEGVLALSYSVSGARGAPTVFVNPLSALTPGVFRQLMQPAPMGEGTAQGGGERNGERNGGGAPRPE